MTGDTGSSSLGHDWIDKHLALGDASAATHKKLLGKLSAEPTSTRIAVFRACYERLPMLREQWQDPEVFARGEQLYRLVNAAALHDLPFHERDLCAVLRSARHGCGHGQDVLNPVDLTRSQILRSGVVPSERLFKSLRHYLAELQGLNSVKAQTAKRRIAILLLLDTFHQPNPRSKPVWSQTFTASLPAFPADSRMAWQQFVAGIKLIEKHDLPAPRRLENRTPRGGRLRQDGSDLANPGEDVG